MDLVQSQIEICRKYNDEYTPIDPGLKLGISDNFFSGVLPLNGLRHPPENDTCGWYLWAGEELLQTPDFFKPMHVSHLIEQNSEVVRFLALPPGWRFLTDNTYVDVWFDDRLLKVQPASTFLFGKRRLFQILKTTVPQEYNETGGLTMQGQTIMDSGHVTSPFAHLHATPEGIHLEARFLGLDVTFSRNEITSIRKKQFLWSTGIVIQHTKAECPSRIEFWTKDYRVLKDALTDLSYTVIDDTRK